MSIRRGNKIIASRISNGFSLFDCKWADHILNNISWLRADTFSWHSGDVYVAAYEHLVNEYTEAVNGGAEVQLDTVAGITVHYIVASDGHKICHYLQEENVQAIYEATGIAWYYILDTFNKQFKLPRTKHAFTGLRDSVGNYVEAGLPNITAGLNNTTWTGAAIAEGAFSSIGVSPSGITPTTGNGGGGWQVGFDASRSSAVYGNSDTVQPRATQMYLYFYVGNFEQSAVEQTAGLNAELFNGKADRDLKNLPSNYDYVVATQEATSANGYTWFRKYKSGWVEQGGRTTTFTNTASGTSDTKAISLPVVMLDSNYSVSVTKAGGGSGWSWRELTVDGKTTTAFTINEWTNAAASGTTCYAEWQVNGMAA